jgi:hypothetical protein
MLSILGLLLQTRPINAAAMQGKGDYSIAELHGVAVYEHRYDAVLDASTSIIMIEMPFLRLRAEMGKLRTKDRPKTFLAQYSAENYRPNIRPKRIFGKCCQKKKKSFFSFPSYIFPRKLNLS